MIDIQRHFSKIANQYKSLRIIDLEPVLYIRHQLDGLQKIQAADVGCGAGRYDLLLFQYIGDRLYLYCLDNNKEMLGQIKNYLIQNKIKNFKVELCSAGSLPFLNESLDCIFSFNAIHHFKIRDFLNEVSRILKSSGSLFIYTRSRTQNIRNIWGKYFPLFSEKETRLYEPDEFREILKEIPELEIRNIEFFNYKRVADLDLLVRRAQNHHYSTFCLYNEDEFRKSLNQFIENLQHNFQDLNHITWHDENILYIIKNQFH
jgi:ubiquinone/menaquinone biosynthesis C-methylase UbiE